MAEDGKKGQASDQSAADQEATVIVSSTGVGPTGFGAIRPGEEQRTLKVGDVLNGIFEVKRFIARGGMGEVFEGINIASDERVAIKVMLPDHSQDSKLLALFRKEARTLTRLNHPALVQYRVLAQEPQLGVFYIVTEFVDGANLSDVVGQFDPSVPDLLDFMRRLARGLDAAHSLGAIHRDLSPDNVMLEGGLLSGARVIDFGIAKELNTGAATIIGDNFAGKLNYVAPEQLGDFDRTIGPWTDIYSLGLVTLAVATRKHVDMGGTLVSAVDKRRAGPDLSAVPEVLRPLLAGMLKPDPADRIRSMGELLDMIDGIEAGLSVAEAAPRAVSAAPEAEDGFANDAPPARSGDGGELPEQLPEPASETDWPEPEAPEPEMRDPEAVEPAPSEPPASFEAALPDVEGVAAVSGAISAEPGGSAGRSPPAGDAPLHSARASAPVPEGARRGKLPLVLAGAAALALAGGAFFWFGPFGGTGGDGPPQAGAADGAAPGRGSDPELVEAALTAELGAMDCAWLDLASVSRGADGGAAAVALRGVVGDMPAVKRRIDQVLADRNLQVAAVDTAQVAPIAGSECVLLDALREIRDPAGGILALPQREVEIGTLSEGPLAGSVGATVHAEFNLPDPTVDFSLLGLRSSGKLMQLTSGRGEVVRNSDDLGNGRYSLPLDVTDAGWSGLVIVTGQQPFDRKLLDGAAGSRTGDWSRRFLEAAKERNWKAEMVWFHVKGE